VRLRLSLPLHVPLHVPLQLQLPLPLPLGSPSVYRRGSGTRSGARLNSLHCVSLVWLEVTALVTLKGVGVRDFVSHLLLCRQTV
jgi:hypothetical protein